MNYLLKPGYCYQWDGAEPHCPRTQEWDTTVFLEGEYKTIEYRGKRTIDGALCAIFYVGDYRGMQRYLAQTCAFSQVPNRLHQSNPVCF